MSAVNWPAIKDALHVWLTTTTGLAAARVLFGGQNATRPPGQDAPWINVWIMGDGWVGHGCGVYKDNPSPSPGAELIKEIHNQRLVTIQITAYGPKRATDALEAHAVLSDALCSLDLSEVSDPLDTAGVGVMTYTDVTTIGGTINTTRIEPRAMTTLQFLTPSVVSRTLTYIETVNTEMHVSTTHAPVDGETGTDVKVLEFDFSLA